MATCLRRIYGSGERRGSGKAGGAHNRHLIEVVLATRITLNKPFKWPCCEKVQNLKDSIFEKEVKKTLSRMDESVQGFFSQIFDRACFKKCNMIGVKPEQTYKNDSTDTPIVTDGTRNMKRPTTVLFSESPINLTIFVRVADVKAYSLGQPVYMV
jgi:hypothetical protein